MQIIQVMLVVISFLHFSKEYQYYVGNGEIQVINGSCNFKDEKLSPCGHFEDVEREITFNPFQHNTINFVMLPVNYTIYKNISLHFPSNNEIKFYTLGNDTSAKIFCKNGDISLHYTNVSEVSIDSIEFYHCGNDKPVISVEDVYKDMYIFSVLFNGSSNHFIKTSGAISEINIVDCLFDGSTQNYGIYIGSHGSSVIVANSTFTNCFKGSLIISSPHLVSENDSIKIFNCTFTNNKAKNNTEGAAITFYSEAIFYLGNCSFIKNTVGSAVVIRSGWYHFFQINCSKFISNEAKHGGAIHAVVASDIQILNSHFEGNYASRRGGAMKIEDTSVAMVVNVSIEYCTFQHNYADSDGGGIFGQSLYKAKIILTIHSSVFKNNKAREKGGALATSTNMDNYYYPSTPHVPRYILTKNIVIILNSSFHFNSCKNRGGALYLNEVNDVTVRNSDFSYNSARDSPNSSNTGGAVYLNQNYPSMFLADDSSFSGNTAGSRGGALFCKSMQNNEIQITGTIFSNNTATFGGGAIYLWKSILKLNATTLSDNKALQGGAVYISIAQLSIVDAIFISNRAYTGGAIYSTESDMSLHGINLISNMVYMCTLNSTRLTFSKEINYFHFRCNDAETGKGGGIYIKDTESSCDNSCPLTWSNDSVIQYINNSAATGSVLYGGMISKCSLVRSKHSMEILMRELWDTKINNAITSKAIHFCFIHDAFNLYCTSRTINKTTYLGQAFKINVACLDQAMQPQQCNIKGEYSLSTKINLGSGEQSRDIESYKTLAFHAYSETENYATLVMTSDIFCTSKSSNTLTVDLHMKDCPYGFEKKIDHCNCDNRLTDSFETVKCNIDNTSISVSEKGWFGYDEEFLRVHKNCPLNYCSQNENTISVSHPHTPCADKREGILCGQCMDNYSIAIGSWKCKDCSGDAYKRFSFIWLTILLAMAGVMLVVFLLLVKMTVSSGTTNGLILYANILSVSGLLDLRNCSIHPVLRVFLSWINLDLGIEVCYYSGMDVYQKTWLQFIFPFYIWFLVGVIILFCHYSSRVMKLMGMRNIEVLATLFLLSYAKLLKTIVTALTFTSLKVYKISNTSDTFSFNKVWLYDANIDYLSPKHLPLFIMAVVFLVFLFVPYTLLLLFGQCITSIPNRKGLHWVHSPKLSTILDAYFAPYKKHTRFWTGLGLVLRCVLFTIYGTSYSINNNLFWIIISVGLLILFRCCYGGQVYQKKAVDLIEIIFIANLGAMALILHHRGDWCEALTTSVSLSLTLFVGILFFHVYWEMKKYTVCRNCFQKLFFLNSISNISIKETSRGDNEKEDSTEERGSHSITYVELRETLIDN